MSHLLCYCWWIRATLHTHIDNRLEYNVVIKIKIWLTRLFNVVFGLNFKECVGIFSEWSLSSSLILFFSCQSHIENIVYNWHLIAAVATVLFKPTHFATKAYSAHARALRIKEHTEGVS